MTRTARRYLALGAVTALCVWLAPAFLAWRHALREGSPWVLLPDRRHLVAVALLAHVAAIAVALVQQIAPRRLALWLARARGARGRGWRLHLLDRALRAAIASVVLVGLAQPVALMTSSALFDDWVAFAAWLQWPVALGTAWVVAVAALGGRVGACPAAAALLLLAAPAEFARTRLGISWPARPSEFGVPTFVPCVAALAVIAIGVGARRWSRAVARTPRSPIGLCVVAGLLAIASVPGHPLAPLLAGLDGCWRDGNRQDPDLWRMADGRVTRYWPDDGPGGGLWEMGPIGWRPWGYAVGDDTAVRLVRLRPWTVGWHLRQTDLVRKQPPPAALQLAAYDARAAAYSRAVIDRARRQRIAVDELGVTLVEGRERRALPWSAIGVMHLERLPRRDPPAQIVHLTARGHGQLALCSVAPGFDAFRAAATRRLALDADWRRRLATPSWGGPFDHMWLRPPSSG